MSIYLLEDAAPGTTGRITDYQNAEQLYFPAYRTLNELRNDSCTVQ